jgi:hypothetical protein
VEEGHLGKRWWVGLFCGKEVEVVFGSWMLDVGCWSRGRRTQEFNRLYFSGLLLIYFVNHCGTPPPPLSEYLVLRPN